MSDRSAIAWTDATWNPVRGCSRVSAGCDNCYAIRYAHRWNRPGGPYDGLTKEKARGLDWTGEVRFVPHTLDQPLRWARPRRIFVNSMSDLFHESVPDEQIAAIFGVMLLAKQHTFQVLTKRPKRMVEWFRWMAWNPVHFGASVDTAKRFEAGPAATCLALLAAQVNEKQVRGPLFTAVLVGGMEPAPDAPILKKWPLPNVWLGVSVEDQATADERIPLLLQTPAAVRFVSAEPLLGPVAFPDGTLGQSARCHECGLLNRVDEDGCCLMCGHDSMRYGLDWVIVGGESGPGARPMDVAWARSIVAECRSASVPVFVKQLGARPQFDERTEHADWLFTHIKDSKGGDPSEWPEDLRVREWPA